MEWKDRYHAKLAIMARDGRTMARDILLKEYDVKDEIMDFYFLSMKLEIYENSPEHLELIRLTNKYETREVLNTEVW